MNKSFKGWFVTGTQPVKNIFKEMNRYLVGKCRSQNNKKKYYYEFPLVLKSKVNKNSKVKRYPDQYAAYCMHNLVPERGINMNSGTGKAADQVFPA